MLRAPFDILDGLCWFKDLDEVKVVFLLSAFSLVLPVKVRDLTAELLIELLVGEVVL